jgi:multiple sugar transport system substrate-binding protein
MSGGPHSFGQITRRALVGGTLAAGAAALLWPYTPRDRVNVPRGRVELQYWEKWTGIEGAALRKVVDRFNASQDRIWVHVVPVSDITSKAMVAIGGGDPPDIVGLYTYSVPGYAEAKAVMPLDAFGSGTPTLRGGSSAFSQSSRLDPSLYLPGIRDLLFHQGRQWAGVNTCYTLAMYYNRAMLKEIGRDPDSPPRTISELDEVSAKLIKYETSGSGLLERAGFLANVPGWWNYFWPIMFGGTLYDAKTDTATVASKEGIAAFEWLRASAAKVGVRAGTAFASGYGRNIHSAQDPFISSHMGMYVQGPWLANFIRAVRPDLDYGAAPVPVADGMYDPERPCGLLEADILMIPRGCPHPEEAFEFLCFMQRVDVQEELALAHCKPSPFLSMSPGFLENHPNRAIRAFDAVAHSPRVQVLPRTTAWKQYADLINKAFDEVWTGADPTTVLTRVQTRGQQIIDAAALRRKQRQLSVNTRGGTGGSSARDGRLAGPASLTLPERAV